MIPFVDLKAQYDSIKDEIDEAIQNVLNNTSFIMGEELKKFEEEFAQFCDVKHAVGRRSNYCTSYLYFYC